VFGVGIIQIFVVLGCVIGFGGSFGIFGCFSECFGSILAYFWLFLRELVVFGVGIIRFLGGFCRCLGLV